MTLRTRLYVLLFALILVVALGVVFAFVMTGQLTSSRGEFEKFAETEFADIYHALTEYSGDTAIQLISLSQALSKNLEYSLQYEHIPANQLGEYPDALEIIIERELIRLQYALDKSKCSGVFMILDTTINPELPNADQSKAGLHIRNAEPRIPGTFETSWHYFRGFPGIAYRNGLLMQKKWDMEFGVEGIAFYHLLMEEARNSALPLSKLYFWSMESVLSESDQLMLTCSIPIIDSAGYVLGVCGFEISQWNFATSFSPDDNRYHEVLFMFGREAEGLFETESALISGRPAAINPVRNGGALSVSAAKGLQLYQSEKGNAYYGLHDEVGLLSADSPFAGGSFYASLLFPKKIVDSSVLNRNVRLISICAALLLLAAIVSIYASRRYLNPIMSAFENIKSGNIDGAKTHIVEIDQLIEKIKEQRLKGTPLPDNLFDNVFMRIKSLTLVETEILRYYTDDLSDKEIMSKMFIDKYAIRQHNGKINDKLGVKSQRELILYVELLKMSGLADKLRA